VRELPLIVVMPDGLRGFYTNNAGGPPFARYVGEELVRFVERNFPARPERAARAIGGLSMGGYGAMRLLSEIDYAGLRDRPRPLIGFSDITALHAAIHRECGINSFHGPTARGKLSDFTRKSLIDAVTNHEDSCGIAPNGRVIREGKARGRLAGGNLALITALQGTPYSVDFDGAILVIEDTGEAVYRIDRMLRQLILGGALHHCVALVAGDFRSPTGDKTFDSRAVDDLLAEAADIAGIPCLAGAPFGHIADQWTIPIGAVAELDTSDLSLRVTGG
jgi:muramoyltetrapeptide carboxypeptidase